MAVYLLGILLGLGSGEQQVGSTMSNLAYFISLKDGVKKDEFLETLGKKKNLLPLLIIANQDSFWGDSAAYIIAENLNSKNAIAYCGSLPQGKRNWKAVIISLTKRRKVEVVDYFKRLVPRLGPYDRSDIYQRVGKNKWPELAEFARRDLQSNFFLEELNPPLRNGKEVQPYGTPLKFYAKSYLEQIEESSPSEEPEGVTIKS